MFYHFVVVFLFSTLCALVKTLPKVCSRTTQKKEKVAQTDFFLFPLGLPGQRGKPTPFSAYTVSRNLRRIPTASQRKLLLAGTGLFFCLLVFLTYAVCIKPATHYISSPSQWGMGVMVALEPRNE